MFDSLPEPARRAFARIGGTNAVARLVRVTPQAVSQWHQVPVRHVMALAAAGGVPAHELRPDVFPAPAALPASAPDRPVPAETANG